MFSTQPGLIWIGTSKLEIWEDVVQNTHIVLLGASPEVDAACVAGDVEHSQALQAGQRHGNAIALQTEEGLGEVQNGAQCSCKHCVFHRSPSEPRLSVCACASPPAELAAPGSCRSSAPALWSPALRTTSCSWCDCCGRRRSDKAVKLSLNGAS